MSTYSGYYYLEEGPAITVKLAFGTDRLTIFLQDGSGRELYWYYDQIQKDTATSARVLYSGYPRQALEVNHPIFREDLSRRLFREKSSVGRRLFRGKASGLVKVLLVMALLLGLAYFVGVPYLADRLARRVPVSYEEKIGEGMMGNLKSGFKIQESQTLLLNDFFSELNIKSNYPIKITVVEEDVSNAFAVPGGNIVVYSRLLNELDHYEELAALLSHEFVHIQNRHTTRSLFRQMASSLFLYVILGDLGSVGSIAIHQADRLKSLQYSRALEKESDKEGLKILTERMIDGDGFIRLFRVLEAEQNRSGGAPSEWVSSHPDLKKRMDYIRSDPGFNKNGTAVNETLKSIFERIKAAGH